MVYRVNLVTNVMDNMSILSMLTPLTFCIRGFSHGRKTRNAGLSPSSVYYSLALASQHTHSGCGESPQDYVYYAIEFDGTRTPPSGGHVTTLIVAQSSMSDVVSRMALFLLRSSYQMLMAVCFLLGVNVFTFYVLNQGGGLSLGEMCHCV